MRMDLVIGKRVLKNGLVLATTLITCTVLQANEHEEKNPNNSGVPSDSGAPQRAEQGAGALGAQKAAGQASQEQRQQFIQKAMKCGQVELQLGQLAQQKGQNQEVKNLGQTMVREHAMANQQLQQLAKSMNETAPDGGAHPAPNRPQAATDRQTAVQPHGEHADKEAKHQQEFAKLQNQTGAEFDKEFVRMAIKHHQKDIKEFEQAQQNLQDAQLNSFIQQTLPKLRQHLQMAQNAARAVGVDASALNNEAGVGAPPAGQQGATPPGQLKPRSAIELENEASLSGEAKLGDREYSTDANVNVNRPNRTADVDLDADVEVEDDDGKFFQKGDGKVLGLPTSKTDGKFLGIIPAPGSKDKVNETDVSIETDANPNDAIGSAAEVETGSDTDVEVEVEKDADPEQK